MSLVAVSTALGAAPTTSTAVVAQTEAGPIAIVGIVGLPALFLSLTAHLAARNVLGDVPIVAALGVGIGPVIVMVATVLLSLPGVVGVAIALAVDAGAIHLLYGQPRRTSAYVTAIHVIVTVILGSVLFGLAVLLVSLPG